MHFKFRHWNRQTYPTKHILICEDNITNQLAILEKLRSLFEPEGHVQLSVVPGSLAAASIISQCKVDLILLDHDMPEGNGADLLQWMRNYGVNIPIITFSGIPQNNEIMISLGATHKFEKCQVLTGAADQLILSLLA